MLLALIETFSLGIRNTGMFDVWGKMYSVNGPFRRHF